jgi:hypothetical protein
MSDQPAIVTASEIADFVFCPEAWRLEHLGTPSANEPQREAAAASCRPSRPVTRRATCMERSMSGIPPSSPEGATENAEEEIRCQFIILARKDEEIRRQFIILARKDEPTSDYAKI